MGEFVEVAKLRDVAEGELLGIEVDGELICLAKVAGVVYACSDACPHQRGTLSEGKLHGGVLTCPLHGAQFHLRTGKVLRWPARQDIQTYPLRIVGESILLQLPQEIVGKVEK